MPVTITASLMLSVSVTVLPGYSVPIDGEAMACVTTGGVVSICGLPWTTPVSDRLAELPAAVQQCGAVEVDRRHH